MKDDPFDDWPHVRESLINGIIPHRNAEKAELKLRAIKQKNGRRRRNIRKTRRRTAIG